MVYTLEQLRGFVAVADELHFGRAAERLKMTQPPLSRQIQKLERSVGVQLLERDNRRVTLTAAGAVFLAEAAVRTAELTVPVPPAQAGRLLEVLLAEGVDRDELDSVLAHLPVEPETAAKVAALAAAARQEG